MRLVAILVSCFIAHSKEALEAGDIIFTKKDLNRTRHVIVHPGHRLVLVKEWPGKLKKAKASKTIPDVIHSERVPQDRRGDFKISWLPGVTVQALHCTDFIKPRRTDVDEELVATLEQIFEDALQPGQSDADMQQHVIRLREEVSQAVGGDCMDDPVVNADAEGKLRAVLAVFGEKHRLAWAITHMFDDSYLEGNELMLGDLHTKDLGFDFRLHVWHDWVTPRNISFYSMPHEHGQTMIASTQVVGHLEQHVYWSKGELYGDGGFDPILLRIDEGAQVTLPKVEFEGSTMRMEAGNTYLFPVRWTHTVLGTGGVQSISLEVRKAVFGKNCAGNLPPRIRVLDHWKKPKIFTDMMYVRWPVLRKQVAAFLRGDLGEDLNIDGPHMDLTPAEKKELERTQRFYEGMKVRMTHSRKTLLKAFRKSPPRHQYDERMDPMLGYVFTVWKQLSDRMVSLIDPSDGLGIGPSMMEPWYFPPSILTPVEDGLESDSEL